MARGRLEVLARSIVSRPVRGEFAAAVGECKVSRSSPDDLAEVMRSYGCHFIEPPQDAHHDLDAVAVRDSPHPTWSVCVPLWSKEEGRSDLTLEPTIIRHGDRWDVELDDLHVP